MLARATKSQNLYKQMVGRVLRLAEGKTDAVLLDCAGVISDLGLPTEPIKPRKDTDILEAKKPKCAECGSERVYRVIKNDKIFKRCAECGHSEEIVSQTGYECSNCGRIHGNDATFSALDGKLYLSCECGGLTLISEATAKEELKVIFDRRITEALQKKVSGLYCTALINHFGTDILYRDDFKRQMQAINAFIEQSPEAAVGATLKNVSAKIIPGIEWRLLSERDENDLLGPVADEESFYQSRSFAEAVQHLQPLLKANDRPPLKQWVIDKTSRLISDSWVNGIEAMTVKRLKNLYSGGKDCNSVDAFVEYIEGDRRGG